MSYQQLTDQDLKKKADLKAMFPDEVKEVFFVYACEFEATMQNDENKEWSKSFIEFPTPKKKPTRLIGRKTIKPGLCSALIMRWLKSTNMQEKLYSLDFNS